MRLLRPNVPVGVHVWRDAPDGPILEAAAVDGTGFEWRGRHDREPPANFTELALRVGREAFLVHDSDPVGRGNLPGVAFLEAIVSAGLDVPGRLAGFAYPGGVSISVPSVEPLDLDSTESRREVPAWDDSSIFPAGESSRVAKYRRHQSWYRANVLRAAPGSFMSYAALGSYLHVDAVAADPSLNFLSAEAEAHAAQRAFEVRKENGALDPRRLRHNLLSSMPLCFNLFGSLRSEPAFLELFQRVFDASAVGIIDVLCEYAPQPPGDFLADRTAFDAVVFYESTDGPRFMGVETKYTEPFSTKEYERDRYNEVTRTSGWFESPETAPQTLKSSKSNQLWRNILLAASLDAAGTHGAGSVAVVALEDDHGARRAIDIIEEHLVDSSYLVWAPIEKVLAVADTLPELSEWSLAFRLRYIL